MMPQATRRNYFARVGEDGEGSPLLYKDGTVRKKKASLFAPGQRLRMNIVPMFINIFLPWGVFVYCYGLTGFSMMCRHATYAWAAVAVVFVLWLVITGMAVWSRSYDSDPSWFSMLSLLVLAMAVMGTIGGLENFRSFEKDYCTISDMRDAKNVDPSVASGEDVMDAGIFEFVPGTQLASEISWHFKKKTIYCVAPIISNTSAIPLRQTYDFWAVGKDCCAVGSSDFRCGSWGSATAHKGIRSLNVADLEYYRLAVQQTAALYDIMAPHPLFLDWSIDPVAEVASWHQQSLKNFMVTASFAFMFCVFVVAMASARFAYLARGSSAMQTEFYNSEEWKEGREREVINYEAQYYTP